MKLTAIEGDDGIISLSKGWPRAAQTAEAVSDESEFITMASVSGIYVILNTRSGRVYIGQAVDFKTRWKKHKRELNGNYHGNRHLQAAWNKYGAQAFEFKVLEYCPVDQLDEREQHFLDIYMPKGICYNIAQDVRASARGLVLSAEHRQKIGAANKGRTLSEEHRRKISAAAKNISAETRRKMSVAAKGRTFSAEHRRKIGNANKGRIHSAETRSKMSSAALGKSHSAETRRLLSEMTSERYIVTSPEGVEFEIKGLNRFCRENNLNDSGMSRVANGRYTHHKGWKCRKVDPVSEGNDS